MQMGMVGRKCVSDKTARFRVLGNRNASFALELGSEMATREI